MSQCGEKNKGLVLLSSNKKGCVMQELRDATEEEITESFSACPPKDSRVKASLASTMRTRTEESGDENSDGSGKEGTYCDACKNFGGCVADDCDFVFSMGSIGFHCEGQGMPNPLIRKEIYRFVASEMKIKLSKKDMDEMSELEVVEDLPECCIREVVKAYPMVGGICDCVGFPEFDMFRTARNDDREEADKNVEAEETRKKHRTNIYDTTTEYHKELEALKATFHWCISDIDKAFDEETEGVKMKTEELMKETRERWGGEIDVITSEMDEALLATNKEDSNGFSETRATFQKQLSDAEARYNGMIDDIADKFEKEIKEPVDDHKDQLANFKRMYCGKTEEVTTEYRKKMEEEGDRYQSEIRGNKMDLQGLLFRYKKHDVVHTAFTGKLDGKRHCAGM
jgi:ElaB/YqjD/DUF883 family membrane-anchored ribosome-binding protein